MQANRQIKKMYSLPNDIVHRFESYVPDRLRSAVIAKLMQQEIEKREHELYLCALEVEKDKALNEEMKEWRDAAVRDSSNETW